MNTLGIILSMNVSENAFGTIILLLLLGGFMYLINESAFEPIKKFDSIRRDIAKYIKENPERKPLRTCSRR